MKWIHTNTLYFEISLYSNVNNGLKQTNLTSWEKRLHVFSWNLFIADDAPVHLTHLDIFFKPHVYVFAAHYTWQCSLCFTRGFWCQLVGERPHGRLWQISGLFSPLRLRASPKQSAIQLTTVFEESMDHYVFYDTLSKCGLLVWATVHHWWGSTWRGRQSRCEPTGGADWLYLCCSCRLLTMYLHVLLASDNREQRHHH